MQTNYLLHNKWKRAGWIILIPATILGIMIASTNFQFPDSEIKIPVLLNQEFFGKMQFATMTKINLTNSMTGILFLLGAMLVGFSREKKEDEFIAGLRLSALIWAVCINYIILLLAFILVFGLPFLSVMVYNMFTVLILFIARFNYLMYKNSKATSDAE